jgi:hypothetical protein
VRDWALPAEANLTPKAAERVAREATCQSSFDNAARALNADWPVTLDGKQVQRWGEALGAALVRQRDRQVRAYQEGRRPPAPANPPQLLVIGLDGGRYQGREQDPQTHSRWREDKVVTVSSYLPGDGGEGPDARRPKPLVTTHVATAANAAALGPMARVEAERRGYRQAEVVIGMGDGGNWIDPLFDGHFKLHARIIDWCHAKEHLWDSARAAFGTDAQRAAAAAERWEALLWNGQVKEVISALVVELARLGEPAQDDGPEHPRTVLRRDAGYFTRHEPHMDYPSFRRKGWPIGSGVTEAGVKQFNKRVKGTEQFWSEQGVETILALRGTWISQDQRWEHHWKNRAAYVN